MSRFENKLCPVCRARFNDKADVVVCPECGTPHHRVCWLTKGHCAVEEYHATGFVWNGRLPDEPQPSPESTIIEKENEVRVEILDGDAFFQTLYASFRDTTVGSDGVCMKELCAFAGRSLLHFGRAFGLFRAEHGKRKQRGFLNLAAGFFAPVYQFYRGTIGQGVIAMLVMLATSMPMLLGYAGVLTVEQLNSSEMSPILMLCNLVNFALMVVFCMFSDYLYYKYAIKSIMKVREKFGEDRGEDYYKALSEKGKPSWLRAVVGFLTLCLLSAVVIALPEFIM